MKGNDDMENEFEYNYSVYVNEEECSLDFGTRDENLFYEVKEAMENILRIYNCKYWKGVILEKETKEAEKSFAE